MLTLEPRTLTWIAVTPTVLGYAAGVSDIRVTWRDGRPPLDCLQKIYPVGRFIAAGFAGSVEFGFWAINDLRRYLYADDPQGAWIPGWVAFHWYRRARRVFAHAPESIKQLGAQLTLLGVSPNVDVGIPGWARSTVAVMRSPDFVPRILKPEAVESIGSGALVDLYVDMLRKLGGNRSLWQMEVGAPGGYAYAVQHSVQRTIEQHPEATVSPHVHWCVVRRGEIRIGTSDHSRISASGERTEWKMPPVATTWRQFQAMVQAAGADASAATG